MKSEYGSWGDLLAYKKPANPKDAIKVDIITLLEALNGVKPTIIKCNAEGGEYELIRQLLITDMRPKFMILMVHTEMGNVAQIWKSLNEVGYNIKIVRDHPKRPVWHVMWN